jgi:antitoxin component of MazEF toxin-antitoxin module
MFVSKHTMMSNFTVRKVWAGGAKHASTLITIPAEFLSQIGAEPGGYVIISLDRPGRRLVVEPVSRLEQRLAEKLLPAGAENAGEGADEPTASPVDPHGRKAAKS